MKNKMIAQMLRDGDGIAKKSAARAKQYSKQAQRVKQNLRQAVRNRHEEFEYDEV